MGVGARLRVMSEVLDWERVTVSGPPQSNVGGVGLGGSDEIGPASE